MGAAVIHHLAFAFGLLGNLISFGVYLAPIPTFYRICKKKTTAEFQSLPYVVSLFSAMLWIYYAFIKTNTALLITINSVGCVIETVYIVIFLAYATPKAKINTAKLLLLLNLGLFGLIVLITMLAWKGDMRLKVLGWICVTFSVTVFAAPLSIMRKVVRTKSVEYMPFLLSFFLTLSAIAWFGFGLFSKDIYIALPNVLGFSFGIAQMILYICYKDSKPKLPKSVDSSPAAAAAAVQRHLEGHDIVAVDMATLHAVVAAAVAAGPLVHPVVTAPATTAVGIEPHPGGGCQMSNVTDQTAITDHEKGVQNEQGRQGTNATARGMGGGGIV